MSDVTSILSQIRSYQHQMGTRALEPNPGAFAPNRVGLEQPGVKAPSFGETLQNALESQRRLSFAFFIVLWNKRRGGVDKLLQIMP